MRHRTRDRSYGDFDKPVIAAGISRVHRQVGGIIKLGDRAPRCFVATKVFQLIAVFPNRVRRVHFNGPSQDRWQFQQIPLNPVRRCFRAIAENHKNERLWNSRTLLRQVAIERKCCTRTAAMAFDCGTNGMMWQQVF